MKLPQVNLRDLFWLLLVVAVSLGWWLDQDRITRRMAALAEQKEQYSDLMRDVVLAQQRCEQIIDEWAELKEQATGKAHPPLLPTPKRTDDEEI